MDTKKSKEHIPTINQSLFLFIIVIYVFQIYINPASFSGY
jgi:hypothetical protein